LRWGLAGGHVGPIKNNTNLKRFYIGYGNDNDRTNDTRIVDNGFEDKQDDVTNDEFVGMKELKAWCWKEQVS